MDKITCILPGELKNAASSRLLLNEFTRYEALRAGLEPVSFRRGIGVLFLRTDATFDPYELARMLHGRRRDNIVLTDKKSDPVGYVLDAEHAQQLQDGDLPPLPAVCVRGARRITPYNYADILWERQEAVRRSLAAGGVFFESEEVTLSPLYTVGHGTLIGRGTVLAGSGSIGENCLITESELTDVRLGANVSVKRSVLIGYSVAEGTTVGPFAHLCPKPISKKG